MLFPLIVGLGFIWLLLLFSDIRKEVKSLKSQLENFEKALATLRAKQE